jgi:WD40 repeat protein
LNSKAIARFVTWHIFIISILVPQTITSVCTLADGRLLASGSADNIICAWDVNTGVCESKLQGLGTVCEQVEGRSLLMVIFRMSVASVLHQMAAMLSQDHLTMHTMS